MSLVPGKKAASVDNTARRVWDKDEARKKAEEKKKDDDEETALDIKKRKRLERDPLHQGLIVQRSQLKQREYQIDLASRLGKTQVVGLNTPLNQQAGYYCQVCDCILRDSQSYLDHINGKWHNRALGMTMRVEKSTVDQIKQKLQKVKEDKEKQKHDDDFLPDGIERRIAERVEEEEREKEERKERRREERKKQKEEKEKEEEDLLAAAADPEMMAMMGFGGFGGSKK